MIERPAVRALRPRRRLSAVIALGALALGGLAGCRSDAGSAAFVGSSRISYAEVNAAAVGAPATQTSPRAVVAADLAFIELAKRYASDNHLTLPPVTAAELADVEELLAIPAADGVGNPYVTTRATAITDSSYLTSKAPSVTPTDAEVAPGYASAVAAGVVPASQLASYKTNLLQVTGIGQTFGLLRALQVTEKKYGVEINPRYAPVCSAAPCPPLAFVMLQLQTQGGAQFDAVSLPLGSVDTDPAVLDTPGPTVVPSPSAGDTAPPAGATAPPAGATATS